jgi:hypothetical protein
MRVISSSPNHMDRKRTGACNAIVIFRIYQYLFTSILIVAAARQRMWNVFDTSAIIVLKF